jgi:hypothetical protein
VNILLAAFRMKLFSEIGARKKLNNNMMILEIPPSSEMRLKTLKTCLLFKFYEGAS